MHNSTSFNSARAPIVPTWNVLNPDGTNKETLKHCFLQRMILDLGDGIPDSIRIQDKVIYRAIYTDFIFPESDLTKIPVIISFQSHTYGNFAIIRNYSPKASPKVSPSIKD